MTLMADRLEVMAARLEVVTARQDIFSTFQERLCTDKYKNTGVNLGTPEFTDDLVAPVGSTMGATRWPFLGINSKEGGFTTRPCSLYGWKDLEFKHYTP